jgi:hypothetical protein
MAELAFMYHRITIRQYIPYRDPAAACSVFFQPATRHAPSLYLFL